MTRKRSTRATTTEKSQHQHTRPPGQPQPDFLICSYPSGTVKSMDLEETESQSNFLNVSECFLSPVHHKDFPTWNNQLSQSTRAPSTSGEVFRGQHKAENQIKCSSSPPKLPPHYGEISVKQNSQTRHFISARNYVSNYLGIKLAQPFQCRGRKALTSPPGYKEVPMKTQQV